MLAVELALDVKPRSRGRDIETADEVDEDEEREVVGVARRRSVY